MDGLKYEVMLTFLGTLFFAGTRNRRLDEI